MDINTEDRSHAAVVAMYQKCVDILSLCLTRSDYHDALEVIDAAVELAEAVRLSEEMQQQYRELQTRCMSLLQKEYRASEHHERDYYIKSTSTKPSSSSTTPPSPAAAASPPHEDEEGEKVARPSSRRRKSVAWFDQVTVPGTRPQMTMQKQ